MFAVALAVRAGILLAVDEPLLYSRHFDRALLIAEQPDPVGFVLGSDEWRAWGTAGSSGWTLAPLYYLFAAGVVAALGPHLLPLQLVQCALEAATAVGVGSLGRALAGPVGAWAGVAYAVNWHAITFHAGADTENLHTVLLVGALALLARPGCGGAARPALGGFVLGLSALARAVSFAFLPLVAAWQLRELGLRRGWRRAALTLGCGLLAVLPWSLRNAALLGEVVPIETVSIFNLWNDNAFVDEGRWGQQARILKKQATTAGRQSEALRFALRAWTRTPRAGLEKVAAELDYFFRPSEAHQLLAAEFPSPAWRYVVALTLGDGMFALAVPLAIALAAAGPRSPARGLLLLWLSYYLFLVVVVFHTQVRYRTPFIPFVLACAAGGWVSLLGSERRRRAALGLVAGLALTLGPALPYLGAAGRALAGRLVLLQAQQALGRSEPARADELARAASARDRGSARPWLVYGRWLARAGRPAEAAAAYRRAAGVKPAAWASLVPLPRLLWDAGQAQEAEHALVAAHRLSREQDPWRALEVAWRELEPPRADEVRLGRLDYGAVRGFLSPEDDHRWSRGRAWLRLEPLERAARYEVSLEMGSPQPSPFAAPVVRVRASGGPWASFRLDRQVHAYRFEAPVSRGGLLVELEAPTWCRRGLTPEQGVRVDHVAVRAIP